MIRVFVIPEMLERRTLMPCASIRLFLPLTKKLTTDALTISFGSVDDLEIQDADVIIAHRISLPRIRDIERVEKFCRANGAKFIYDIDDDLLALSSDHTQSAVYEGYKPIVRRALASADQVWVSTQVLAERYQALARDVTIVPNELDPRVWKVSDVTPKHHHIIRFLYMGTPTHRNDFSELVLPSFARLRGEFYQKISLTLIGIIDPTHAHADYSIIDVPTHLALSYPAFAGWLQSIGPYDVGLAPLLNNRFNRAKSNIKQLEYSALGLPTIATNLPPYRDVFCPTGATVLAEPTLEAFYVAMRSLVIDADRRRELQLAAPRVAHESLCASERHEPRLQLIQELVRRSEQSLTARLDGRLGDGIVGRQLTFMPGPTPASDTGLTRMQNLAQASGFFDPGWYRSTYHDVGAAEMDPFEHYVRYGGPKGYNPSSQFDAAAYLAHYPDVSNAGMNPLIHYVMYGRAEGRAIQPVARRSDEFIPPIYPSPISLNALCIAFYFVRARCTAIEDTNSAAQTLIEDRELAERFGIYGFCYYIGDLGVHGPPDDLLSSMLSIKSDFRFCVCWTTPYISAMLSAEPSRSSPKYEPPAPATDEFFFGHIELLLKHSHYLRIDGRAVILIYRAAFVPGVREMAHQWREYVRKQGLGELLLVSTHTPDLDPASIGFDAAAEGAPDEDGRPNLDYLAHSAKDWSDYRDLVKRSYLRRNAGFSLFQTVCAGPKDEALSDTIGFHHSSPAAYQEWLENACRVVCESREMTERVIFVNAWNGSPSGASLRPGPSYGHGYLNATAKALQTVGRQGCILNFAVIAHVFYEDVWPEIATHLRAWKTPFKLCATVPEERAAKLADLICSDFPEARITPVPNRGRDIAPFLHQVKLIVADGIELICKIHTKKSDHRTDGDKWRSDLYEKLLGDKHYPDKILKAFADNAGLGIIAPHEHVIPAEYYWGANADRVHDLMRQINYPGNPNPLMFAAGSMFWVRSQALEALLRLSIKNEDFEEERGQVDGTLAHAIERLFPLVAKMGGYRMVDTRILNVAPGSIDYLRSDAELAHLEKRGPDYQYAPASR